MGQCRHCGNGARWDTLTTEGAVEMQSGTKANLLRHDKSVLFETMDAEVKEQLLDCTH
jgi:hypothetical protein